MYIQSDVKFANRVAPYQNVNVSVALRSVCADVPADLYVDCSYMANAT